MAVGLIARNDAAVPGPGRRDQVPEASTPLTGFLYTSNACGGIKRHKGAPPAANPGRVQSSSSAIWDAANPSSHSGTITVRRPAATGHANHTAAARSRSPDLGERAERTHAVHGLAGGRASEAAPIRATARLMSTPSLPASNSRLRAFARMRRFWPPGVARLGLVI